MYPEKRSIQIGVAGILCGAILLLFGSGAMDPAIQVFTDPDVMSVVWFLETGRVMPPVAHNATQQETRPPQEMQEQDGVAVFAPEDARLVEVNSVCGYNVNVEALLQSSLKWQLRQDAPTVLILHTHGTESYTKTEDYQESSPYRTQDAGHNMISVGEELKLLLENAGIGVIHDKMLHDSPSYSNSYNYARSSIKKYLEQYPSIRLVLDLHRESVEDGSGDQRRFVTKVGDKDVAQLMLVVGTDANGLTHPRWPENMALAVKLQAQLEKENPGICRPISFRKQRFNQDLSVGALIVEIGAAGNTRQEALLATRELANAIITLSAGTQMQ